MCVVLLFRLLINKKMLGSYRNLKHKDKINKNSLFEGAHVINVARLYAAHHISIEKL